MTVTRIVNDPLIFFINVNESTDRRKYMEQQLKGNEFTRIDAITPKTLPPLKLSKGAPPNVLACLCSHLKAWKAGFEKTKDGGWFVVLEDDTRLLYDIRWENLFQSIPNDANILQMFTSNTAVMDVVYTRAKSWTPWKPSMWSAGAYVVSKTYAQKFLGSIAYENNGYDLRRYAGLAADSVLFGKGTYSCFHPMGYNDTDSFQSILHTSHDKWHRAGMERILGIAASGQAPSFFLSKVVSPKRVAILMLTRGCVNHASFWQEFLKCDDYVGHDNTHIVSSKFSLYVHIKEPCSTTLDPFFRKRQVPTVHTAWGRTARAFVSMLKIALNDSQNEAFTLVSDSCIPVKSSDTLYNTLLNGGRGVTHIAFTPQHQTKRIRALVKGDFPQEYLRKHSANFTLSRAHALAIISNEPNITGWGLDDRLPYNDEHMVGTLLCALGHSTELHWHAKNANKFQGRLHTFSNWNDPPQKQHCPHTVYLQQRNKSRKPTTYTNLDKLSVQELFTSPYLFARKFHASCVVTTPTGPERLSLRDAFNQMFVNDKKGEKFRNF